MFDFQPDRAISKLELDRLDRILFVESISKTAVRPEGSSATGVTIGLVGKWGEGKTSILELLRRDLRNRFPKTVVIEFSPWLVSQRHDLLHAFFDELDRSLGSYFEEPIHGSRRSQAIEELSSAFADYLERVAPVVELLDQGSGKVAKLSAFGLKWFSKIYRDRRARDQTLTKLKARVEELLRDLRVPVVVLVDEVDRIEDRDIRELMHLVKAVADFPTISYILAYDEVRVAEALGFEAPFARDRVTRGRKYLEKIVQVPIPLPVIFNEELDRLLDEGVYEVLKQEQIPIGGISRRRYQELKSILIPNPLSTVRDVRRFVSSFAHRFNLVPGDVEWPDVLGFVALSMSAPELSSKIRNSPENYVFDGDISVHTDRRPFDERFKSHADSPHERNPHAQKLFGFLFPGISQLRTSQDCLLDEIAFKRPLITLLRMKVLSSTVSRAEVISVTQLRGADLANALAKFADEGKAVSFAERLADLAANNIVLPTEEIWIALLDAVDRMPLTSFSKARLRMESMRYVTETLLQLAARPGGTKLDLRRIISSISLSDAFEAASVAIRLASLRQTRGGTLIKAAMDEAGIDETWLLQIGRDVVTKAKAQAQGNQLLPVGVVYLAKDTGLWDDSDREAYATRLASDDDALDMFVIQSFGGNYTTSGKTIDSFFMPLGQFKERVLGRQSEFAKEADVDVDLSDAYGKIFDWIDIDDEEDRPNQSEATKTT